jgi:hypothetical protein
LNEKRGDKDDYSLVQVTVIEDVTTSYKGREGGTLPGTVKELSFCG